jgi:hypothetical protein
VQRAPNCAPSGITRYESIETELRICSNNGRRVARPEPATLGYDPNLTGLLRLDNAGNEGSGVTLVRVPHN